MRAGVETRSLRGPGRLVYQVADAATKRPPGRTERGDPIRPGGAAGCRGQSHCASTGRTEHGQSCCLQRTARRSPTQDTTYRLCCAACSFRLGTSRRASTVRSEAPPGGDRSALVCVDAVQGRASRTALSEVELLRGRALSGYRPGMAGDVLFCSDTFWEEHAGAVLAIDPAVEIVPLVGGEPVASSDLERITIAFLTPDLLPDRSRPFLGVCLRSPNLHWMQIPAAGVDHPVWSQLQTQGVQLSSANGTTAPAIAQTVMLYLLALSRDLPRLAVAQADRQWSRPAFTDLEGLRLGIVGFGSIGHEVARLAEAFSMEVVGLRRTVVPDDPFTTWTGDRLHDVLGWSNAVVVAAPLTEATRNLFDARAFAAMRAGSWFVNVGRGEIVDEDALVAALQSGHLAGAGLDVFSTEPLPVDSPLWDRPNVIITPHCAGDTASSKRRAVELTIENFRRRSAGEPLLNVVG